MMSRSAGSASQVEYFITSVCRSWCASSILAKASDLVPPPLSSIPPINLSYGDHSALPHSREVRSQQDRQVDLVTSGTVTKRRTRSIERWPLGVKLE